MPNNIPALGPRATADLLFNVGGIDGSRLLDFENRNGLTAEQIIAQAAAAIGSANEAISSRWGGVVYFTTDQYARYRQGEGAATKTPVKSEFAVTDAVRSDETGHMLPLAGYHDSLAWSLEYLRDAYQSQIDVDLEVIRERWFNRGDSDILNRIFSDVERPIGSGYDVPWAIASGVNVPYLPPQYQAQPFDSNHTHFQWVAGNTAAAFKNLLDKMVTEMRHHGIRGDLVCLTSESDVETWAAVQGFVKLQPEGINIIGANNERIEIVRGKFEGIPGETFGWVNTLKGVVELKYLENIPTGYAFQTRSYGVNNPQNGVAIRLYPDQGFGLRPEPMVTRTLTPKLESIDFDAMHGVGINKRLNGVVGQVATGISQYTPPAQL